MMRFILILLFLISTGISFSQSFDNNIDSNGNYLQFSLMMANKGTLGGVSFQNPSRQIKGSTYLFDEWENNGVIYLKDTNQKFLLKNVNINIQRNTFESQISIDSLYAFNPNSIDKFVIHDVSYKNMYSDEGKRIYEVIYESDEFTILKGFNVSLVTGSPNPMVNQKDDKFVRSSSYFVKSNNNIQPMKLKKSKIMELLNDNPEKAAKVEQFISDNNLSYKNVNDLKMALKYSDI